MNLAMNEKVFNRVRKVMGRKIHILSYPLSALCSLNGDNVKPKTIEGLLLSTVTALIMEGHLILKQTEQKGDENE